MSDVSASTAKDSQPDPTSRNSGGLEGKKAGKGSLVVVFLCVFIDLLGFGIVLPLLPLYGRQLIPDDSALGRGLIVALLMSSFSIMQFLFAPVWGRLSDRWGRRPVLMVGLAGSAVFYGLFGLATVWKSLSLLFVARIGAGLAGATISTAQAYIADVTTQQSRVKGMALIGAAFGLGFTFGPLFGFFAVPEEGGEPGGAPGYLAAGLSAFALGLAWFKLPESLRPDSGPAGRKYFDLAGLRRALAVPSIGPLLLALFVCVFSFANFETTLALVIKDKNGAFHLTFKQVCLVFMYIGLTLTIAQGVIVRRLAKRLSETMLASVGGVVELVGFGCLILAIGQSSIGLLLAALTIIVAGFALMTPSLNSLLSRRTDSTMQGGVLGLGQSVSALARIAAPLVGIPLLDFGAVYPTVLALVLMLCGVALVLWAGPRGVDSAAPSEA